MSRIFFISGKSSYLVREISAGKTIKPTHATVDVLSSLSVVSSGASVETSSMVRYPVPLQEQEESLGATHTAVFTGTLQTASTVLCSLSVGCGGSSEGESVQEKVQVNRRDMKVKLEETKIETKSKSRRKERRRHKSLRYRENFWPPWKKSPAKLLEIQICGSRGQKDTHM